jgi:hypothetical protein
MKCCAYKKCKDYVAFWKKTMLQNKVPDSQCNGCSDSKAFSEPSILIQSVSNGTITEVLCFFSKPVEIRNLRLNGQCTLWRRHRLSIVEIQEPADKMNGLCPSPGLGRLNILVSAPLSGARIRAMQSHIEVQCYIVLFGGGLVSEGAKRHTNEL